jgi:hypothetical protein
VWSAPMCHIPRRRKPHRVMPISPIIPIAALCALVIASAPARGGEVLLTSDAIRDFIDHVYAIDRADGQGWEKVEGLLSPGLLEMVRRDENGATARGEVCILDIDPVCQCQGDEAMTWHTVVVSSGPSTSSVVVRDTIPTLNGPMLTDVTYTLVKAGKDWQIDDIGTFQTPSLKRWLQDKLDHPD